MIQARHEEVIDVLVECYKQREFSPFGYFPKQREAIEILTDPNNEVRFFLYGGGAGGGKSWTGWEWLTWNCLAFPETRWFVGRNELKRLRRTTFRTFGKFCKKFGFVEGVDYKVNNQDHYITFLKTGSTIDLLELKSLPGDPLFERFGSYEYTGGWIEEAGEVPFGAYDVLKSRIGRHLNDKYNISPKLFITCNPKKNWLKRKFYDPYIKGTIKKPLHFLQSLAVDNNRIESAYIQNLKELEDSALRDRLLDGSWEYEDNPYRLIEDPAIWDLFSNISVVEGRKYITADVARMGSDLFVIYVWSGWRVIDYRVIKKCSLDEARDIIEDLRKIHAVPLSRTLIDEEGMGAGLVDLMHYQGFVSNAKAIDGNYRNIGVECGYVTAKKINDREVWVKCVVSESHKELLIQDLEAQLRKPRNESEKLDLVRKEDIKEKLRRSPDSWDAFRMRAFFDLEKENDYDSLLELNDDW